MSGIRERGSLQDMSLLSIGAEMNALAAADKGVQPPTAGMQSNVEPLHDAYQLRSSWGALAADRSSYDRRSSTPSSATPSLISSDSRPTSPSIRKVGRKPDKAKAKCRTWDLNPALQAVQMSHALSRQRFSETSDVHSGLDPNLAALGEHLPSQCSSPCDLSANPTCREMPCLSNARQSSSWDISRTNSNISRSSTLSTWGEDCFSDESTSSTPSLASLVSLQTMPTPSSPYCDLELRSRSGCESHGNQSWFDVPCGEYDPLHWPGVCRCSVCQSRFIDPHLFCCQLAFHDPVLFTDVADETCQLPGMRSISQEAKPNKKVETKIPLWGKDVQRTDSTPNDLRQNLVVWSLPTAPRSNIISSESEGTTDAVAVSETSCKKARDTVTAEKLAASSSEPPATGGDRELHTLGYTGDRRGDCQTGTFIPSVSPLQSNDIAHLHVARRASPKPKTYHCTFCDVQFARKSDWVRHETHFHEPQRRWQCPDCNATFYNEASFVRHHKHNHSCAKCVHANEAKMELPRKTAWSCGFCGEVWRNWKERCDHVASHFASGKTKEDWDFSKVISGLLKQDWINATWEKFVVQRHGDNISAWPSFKWESTSDRCLELLQDLEHGHCDQEDVSTLVETAYNLGLPQIRDLDSFHGLCPTDSESIVNMRIGGTESRDSDCLKGFASARSEELSEQDETTSEEESSDDEYSSDSESEDHSPVTHKTPMRASRDDIVGSVLSPVKRELVDGIMDEFGFLFAPTPAVRSHAGSDATSASQTAAVLSGSSSIGEMGSGGRKRGMAEEETSRNRGNGRGNGDDPNKRQKLVSDPKDGPSVSTKLACPFYKRDPEKYRNQRSCPGPGWNTVHRLKSHIYKRHARPAYCPRCWQTFKDESSHQLHQVTEERCTPQPKKLPDGFSKSQESQLRSKKRTSHSQSEEDKWGQVYRILFPEDDPSRVPSPYYVIATDHKEQKADTPSSEEFAGFEQYLRRELPRITRRLVEQDVQMETGEIGERVRAKLREFIPQIIEELIPGYLQSQGSLPTTPARFTNQVNTPLATAMPPLQPSETGIAGERLASLFVRPPPVSDPQPFPDMHNSHQKSLDPNVYSDSGYQSARPSLAPQQSRRGSTAEASLCDEGNQPNPPSSTLASTHNMSLVPRSTPSLKLYTDGHIGDFANTINPHPEVGETSDHFVQPIQRAVDLMRKSNVTLNSTPDGEQMHRSGQHSNQEHSPLNVFIPNLADWDLGSSDGLASPLQNNALVEEATQNFDITSMSHIQQDTAATLGTFSQGPDTQEVTFQEMLDMFTKDQQSQ